jgi:hypothetical protein
LLLLLLVLPHVQVMAMTNLVAAYQANNIKEFEKILAHNK